MPPETTEVKPEADAPLTRQLPFRVSEEQEADLLRRAGEVQAATGVKTSLQDYIRSQLWPNGRIES